MGQFEEFEAVEHAEFVANDGGGIHAGNWL